MRLQTAERVRGELTVYLMTGHFNRIQCHIAIQRLKMRDCLVRMRDRNHRIARTM